MEAKSGLLLGWLGGVAAMLLWAGHTLWAVLVSAAAAAVALGDWLPKWR